MLNLSSPFNSLIIRLRLLAGIMIVSSATYLSAQSFDYSDIKFEEVIADFPREEKYLRKWDAPSIADLDQDGYMDLLINDHGFGIRICWNNKGQFSMPYDVIMGDVHGVTVGDYDKDGSMELIVSRGGGSGTNARNAKIFKIKKDRSISDVPDFDPPLAFMRGRTLKLLDGDNDGDLDLLNFAFPAKGIRGESENYIYANNGSGKLELNSMLPRISQNGQKTLITDYNGDGDIDIILYGQGAVRVFKGEKGLSYKEVSEQSTFSKYDDVTSIVEIDYDLDGDLDYYLTRGLEFEKGETYYDREKKILGFFTHRGAFDFNHIKIGDVLRLENYHTQWPHTNQLYIGETGYDYEHPGETHSGKDLRIVNSDALGFPDHMTKTGVYLGYIGNQEWRIAGDTHSPVTCVIHGVEDYEESPHAAPLTDILLENRDGALVDVTADLLPQKASHNTGSISVDLNNDGWPDLVVIQRGNLISKNEALIYINNNGQSFLQADQHNIITDELGVIGMGVEAVDFDKDGDMDILFGHDRGMWHLYENLSARPSQSSITIVVHESPQDQVSPLGATVELSSCDFRRIKRVGATSAAYSLGRDTHIHFGKLSCTSSRKIKVTWSNGETQEMDIKASESGYIEMGK